MKTIGKLKINSKRELSKSELLELRGEGTCWCYTGDYMTVIGQSYTSDQDTCEFYCQSTYLGQYGSVESVFVGQ